MVVRFLFAPAVTEVVGGQLGGALTGEQTLAVAAADARRALLGREVREVPRPLAHDKTALIQTAVDRAVILDLELLGEHLGGKAMHTGHRVRAVLRRRKRPENGPVERHGIRLDPEAHRVISEGKEVALTATEFRLLEDLMRHAGAVRSREQLLDNVWGYTFEGYARTVDTHMRRLRSKLGESQKFLETVRGVGYRFKD